MFKTAYETAVNKATSSTLPEADIAACFSICDMICPTVKHKEPEVKTTNEIIAPIRKRFNDKRPQVKYLTLQLVDIIIKNCNEVGFAAIFATNFVAEIAESVNGLNRIGTDGHYISKVLELVGLWNESFKNIDNNTPNRPTWLANLKTAYGYLENNGYVFREVKKEDLISHRYKPVIQLNEQTKALYMAQKDLNNMSDEQVIKLIADKEKEEKEKKEREMEEQKLIQQEEEDLARVLELSKIEAGVGPSITSGYPNLETLNIDNEPVNQNFADQNQVGADKQVEPTETITLIDEVSIPLHGYEHDDQNLMTNITQNENNARDKIKIYGSDSSEYLTEEDELFLKNFNKSIEMLNLRIKSVTQRNRSIYTDPTSQQLIASIMSKHSKLHEIMANIDGQRQHYEQFQNTLTEIGHARTAIDEMRLEKVREEEMIKQQEEERKKAEMQAKLEYLRQNKQRIVDRKREQAINNYKQMMFPSYGGNQAGVNVMMGQTPQHYQQVPSQIYDQSQLQQVQPQQLQLQNQIASQPTPNFQTSLPQNTPYPANAPTPSQFSTFSGEDSVYQPGSVRINPNSGNTAQMYQAYPQNQAYVSQEPNPQYLGQQVNGMASGQNFSENGSSQEKFVDANDDDALIKFD